MSRELKFRVWNEDKNKFMPSGFIGISDGKFIDLKNGSVHFDSDDKIIEQFTGLVDRNGKEIYEGDIVKLHKVDEKSFGEKSPLIEIAGFSQKNCEKYNNTAAATTGFFGAILTKKRGSCMGLSWNQAIYEHYEVIGNIHENWELLK